MSESIDPNTLLQTVKTPLECQQCKSKKRENYLIGIIGDLSEISIICESCFNKRLKKQLHEIIEAEVHL